MKRFVFRVGLLMCLGGLVSVRPAAAQAHGQLIVGATSAADVQPFAAGQIGTRAGFFEFDVEGGKMRDVLPKGLADALNEYQRTHGFSSTAVAALPAWYGLAQIRFVSPDGHVHPFASGGFGFARVQPGFKVTVLGISAGDVFGTASTEPKVEPMMALGGGIRFDVGGNGLLDLGYRFIRIYTDFSPLIGTADRRVEANAFFVAYGVKF